MSDHAYKIALERRAKLRKELDEIENFIHVYQRLAGTEPERVDSGELRAEMPSESGVSPATLRQRSLRRNDVAKYAREIILEHGQPMTRGQLVKEFDRRGLPLGGEDRSRNLGTIMWRLKDQFVNLRGRGYWPKDEPFPPGANDRSAQN